jgi:cytochrome P450
MARGASHAAFFAQMACVPTLVGGLPLLGSLLEFLRHSDGLRMPPHAFLHFARRHPKARVLRLSLGPRPDMLLVLDPALARAILKDAEAFPKGQGYRALHAVTPGHLPGLDGAAAVRKRRSVLQLWHRPEFEARLKAAIAPHTERLAERIVAATRARPLEVCEAVRETTLRVLFEVVLGEAPDPELVEALRLLMAEWQHRIVELVPMQHWPRQRRVHEARERMRACLRARLHAARRMPVLRGDRVASSLLRALADDEALSDDERVDLLFTLLATGHENASSFMVWVLVCLAEHEALQADVAREWTSADDETPATDRFLKETLRLYPPIPLLSRRAKSREALHALGIEAHVAGDPELVIAPFVLHRLERIWGPETDAFVPERWRAPSTDMEAAYMPFSNGARACVGYQWAHLLVRSMLRALFGRGTPVRVCLSPDSGPVTPCLDISLKPSGGRVSLFAICG